MKRRTKDFLELCYPKVSRWGLIIIDDVILFKDKMVWLYEFLEEKNINYNIIPVDVNDGVAMILK
jgi:predicted O-methyltransferase YrrM